MHATGLFLWPRMRVRSQVLAYFLTLFLLRGVGAAIVVESLKVRSILPLLAPRRRAAKACLPIYLSALSGGFIRADRRTDWQRRREQDEDPQRRQRGIRERWYACPLVRAIGCWSLAHDESSMLMRKKLGLDRSNLREPPPSTLAALVI
jgi:hypothetical protein